MWEEIQRMFPSDTLSDSAVRQPNLQNQGDLKNAYTPGFLIVK